MDVLYSGFDAFGKVVPNHRISNTQKLISEISNLSQLEQNYLLESIIKEVQHDRPNNIFKDLEKHFDLISIYRIIATLTTG